jgi:hypothetical protein
MIKYSIVLNRVLFSLLHNHIVEFYVVLDFLMIWYDCIARCDHDAAAKQLLSFLIVFKQSVNAPPLLRLFIRQQAAKPTLPRSYLAKSCVRLTSPTGYWLPPGWLELVAARVCSSQPPGAHYMYRSTREFSDKICVRGGWRLFITVDARRHIASSL